ncbi:sporulation protein Cse60 [Enterococcus hirae]|jgi:hypothetical protein|nr:sporulation protein Cse60 [Enterococcaceae bacterium]MCI1920062.1 sporulation protein Cse60 [Enterococcaceae bacterium]MDM8212962.1 sporulation protein Cse60 [Enterococcus hirae]
MANVDSISTSKGGENMIQTRFVKECTSARFGEQLNDHLAELQRKGDKIVDIKYSDSPLNAEQDENFSALIIYQKNDY